MIEINHVDKWYGPGFQALKDCTTKVAKGEVVGVCGPGGGMAAVQGSAYRGGC